MHAHGCPQKLQYPIYFNFALVLNLVLKISLNFAITVYLRLCGGVVIVFTPQAKSNGTDQAYFTCTQAPWHQWAWGIQKTYWVWLRHILNFRHRSWFGQTCWRSEPVCWKWKHKHKPHEYFLFLSHMKSESKSLCAMAVYGKDWC